MAHARQQVREAAVSDLTGLTITGNNVYTGRVAKLAAANLPSLKILLREEDGDLAAQAFGTVLRRGRLIVEGRLQAGDDIEDKLDDLAAEVEGAIYGNTPALDALLQNIGAPITVVDVEEPEEGVAKRIGVIRMLFAVEYRTALADPTTIV